MCCSGSDIVVGSGGSYGCRCSDMLVEKVVVSGISETRSSVACGRFSL